MQTEKNISLEEILSVSARLQNLFPRAVLVGGTAAAVHARHRVSFDADHVMDNLKATFEEVLSHIESESGWRTARIAPPVLILGNFHGVDTGIRQLVRSAPLETEFFCLPNGDKLRIPTDSEILRIKAALILKRNAVRDYLDFAALGACMAAEKFASALENFDVLYPQLNDESALMQLQIQIANPKPFDLPKNTVLSEYKNLSLNVNSWEKVKKILAELSIETSKVLETISQRKNY